MVEITHNSHEACRYLSTNLAHRVKTGPVSGFVGGIPLLTLDSGIFRTLLPLSMSEGCWLFTLAAMRFMLQQNRKTSLKDS